MLGKMLVAVFNTVTGRVNVQLDTSTSTGYPNNCEQYGPYGFISVPLPGQLVELSQQSLVQVQVTGYNNQVTDPNFSLNAGESAQYAQNWYVIDAISGLFIQEANTTNAENQMMGQSTNSVIADILNYLVDLEAYISTHTHSGVSTGTHISGGPTTSPPSPSDLSTDLTYINANQNLAITGTYMPKVPLASIFAKLKGLP